MRKRAVKRVNQLYDSLNDNQEIQTESQGRICIEMLNPDCGEDFECVHEI